MVCHGTCSRPRGLVVGTAGRRQVMIACVGYGSAVGWMLFLIIVVIAVFNVLIMRRLTGDGRRKGGK